MKQGVALERNGVEEVDCICSSKTHCFAVGVGEGWKKQGPKVKPTVAELRLDLRP